MAVAFGGGGFVMGAYSAQGSKLFYSSDLTNWYAATPREPIRDQVTPYYNVLLPVKAPGMDLMIAAGSIWSPIRLGRPATLNSMPAWQFEEVSKGGYAMGGAYGNGLFVLIGLEMATMVSTNGRDWSGRIIGARLCNRIGLPADGDRTNPDIRSIVRRERVIHSSISIAARSTGYCNPSRIAYRRPYAPSGSGHAHVARSCRGSQVCAGSA